MLKIKDNVDLKELRKFGFKETKTGAYVYITSQYQYFFRNGSEKKIKKDVTTESIIVCRDEKRTIIVSYNMKTTDNTGATGMGGSIRELNVLYDLIKADLVEKI